MGYGNERFIQYLASCNSTFNLGNFLDKSGVAGYDMSPFIRRYSKYLNEKCVAYRQMALDFCKSKSEVLIDFFASIWVNVHVIYQVGLVSEQFLNKPCKRPAKVNKDPSPMKNSLSIHEKR